MSGSKVEIWDNILPPQDGNLLYVVNRDLSIMPVRARNALESLAVGRSSEVLEFCFEGSLYGALIGYLRERDVEIGRERDVSLDYIMVIEGIEDQKIVKSFTNEVKKYNNILSKVPSEEESKDVASYIKRLTSLDSKYHNLRK